MLLPEVRRLAIVTHVVHHRHEGRLYAYGPYAREIDVWASLFPEVVLVAPVRDTPPPGDAAVFASANISLRPVRESGGATLGAKVRQVALLPWLLRDVWRGLQDTDAIHVRCPGNVGLLGLLLAPLRSRRLIAKYAGQWEGFTGEALSVRLQRAVLRSRWWRGPVTVYGRRDSDPPHVIAFFTSVMDASHVARARACAAARTFAAPLRVLFVGRLSNAKRVDVVIDTIAQVGPEVVAHGTIVGDGPERDALERRAKALGNRVRFTGAVSFERVLDEYERHDVLVLVSDTEGWPKVVAEAQAFGMLVVASDRGMLRAMLREGGDMGVRPGDAADAAHALITIARQVVQRGDVARKQPAVSVDRAGLRAALENTVSTAWRLGR